MDTNHIEAPITSPANRRHIQSELDRLRAANAELVVALGKIRYLTEVPPDEESVNARTGRLTLCQIARAALARAMEAA